MFCLRPRTPLLVLPAVLQLCVLATDIKEVNVIRLRYLIHDASAGSPACVLFQSDTTVQASRNYQISLQSLWQELPASLKSWNVVVHAHSGHTFDIASDQLPLLRCYMAGGLHKDFEDTIELPRLVLWLRSIKSLHKRVLVSISRIQRPRLEDVICGDVPILLLFHGLYVSEVLAQIGTVLRNEDGVEVVDVFTTSQRGKKIAQHFRLFHFPAVIGFNTGCYESVMPSLRLEGAIEVNQNRIELWALVETSHAHQMNGNDLNNAVSISHMKEPLLVCLYASWVPNVLPFINAFERSVDSFAKRNASLQFALFDVSKNKQHLSRYFNATVLTNLPAVVLFHQSGNPHRVTINSDTLLSEIPTPWTVYTFVKSVMGKFLRDHDGNTLEFLPWSRPVAVAETPCEMAPGGATGMCAASWENLTVNDQSAEVFEESIDRSMPFISKPYRMSHGKPRKRAVSLSQEISQKLNLDTTGHIPVVTSNVWHTVQKMALKPQTAYSLRPGSDTLNPATPVALVVFVQEGCGLCEALLGEFNQLAKSVEFISGAAMFLVNCTTDTSLCQQEDISGYPSLYAYRGFTQPTNCIEKPIQLAAKRVPYHGVFRLTSILEWLSDISMPAVDMGGQERRNANEDSVQLFATLYSQSSARHHFRSLHGRWFTYHCLVTICEQLLGQAVCLASYASDIDHYPVSGDPLVSDITLIRGDGIQATVFSTGRSLSSTLNDHSASLLHRFHATHRYRITPSQTCEENHIKCTSLLVQYVRDHRRPPVISITDKIFHVDEDLLSDLPVMIALAHEANLSKNSSFYLTYSAVAKKLYSNMVFSTVNVDLYPSWAGKFVPLGFWSSMEAQAVYPRLCIVQGKDHTQAAFYPDMHSNVNNIRDDRSRLQWTDEVIIEFAENFLREPHSLLVKTEHF